MPITISEGGTCFSGPKGIELYRLITLKHGLRVEIRTGMKMSRGPKCSTIARRVFGLKGSPAKLLAQIEKMVEAQQGQVTIVDERLAR